MTEEPQDLDLSAKTFDEFLAFFFDRAVVPDKEQFYLFLSDASCDRYEDSTPSRPEVVVGYLTRLFSNFSEIAPGYSLEQIDQGIWGVWGEALRLYELLWDSSVPLEQRLGCIRSMYVVYANFVSKSEVEVMVNCFDMWWDMILHGFWCQHKFFEWHEMKFQPRIKTGEVSKLDPESRSLLDVMFETLKKILELPDLRTQKFALHGLGHLYHPGVRELVQRYIDQHRNDLTEEGLRWVQQCRDGTVM